MAGIYRRFEISPLTANQAEAAKTALDNLDKEFISMLQTAYDVGTSVFSISIGIDTELLPQGVTAADLRTRVRNWFQTHAGRLPDVDIARVAGEDQMTARDRCRQFIDAWNNNTDPETIGIEGHDLADRRARLKTYMDASRAAWGL